MQFRGGGDESRRLQRRAARRNIGKGISIDRRRREFSGDPCRRKKIFHAGDLNDWHWQDESTFREVEIASMHYRKILKRIADENPRLDIVFFPVDPRQGSDFERGAREFLSAVRVENFFPMHFDGKYRAACNFAAYNSGNETRCFCLHHPGHSVEIDA